MRVTYINSNHNFSEDCTIVVLVILAYWLLVMQFQANEIKPLESISILSMLYLRRSWWIDSWQSSPTRRIFLDNAHSILSFLFLFKNSHFTEFKKSELFVKTIELFPGNTNLRNTGSRLVQEQILNRIALVSRTRLFQDLGKKPWASSLVADLTKIWSSILRK